MDFFFCLQTLGKVSLFQLFFKDFSLGRLENKRLSCLMKQLLNLTDCLGGAINVLGLYIFFCFFLHFSDEVVELLKKSSFFSLF